MSEIGDAENISKSYVSQILRLALLAPDIIEAIVAGRADQSLMLEKLERPLPASWEEQRTRLLEGTGFEQAVHWVDWANYEPVWQCRGGEECAKAASLDSCRSCPWTGCRSWAAGTPVAGRGLRLMRPRRAA